MLLRGYVPNNFSLRVVDPILKDNFGDLSSVDNYGLVILSPTIAKIFESILLIKYGDYLYSVLLYVARRPAMLGLMGFSGSLPILCLLIDQIKMLACFCTLIIGNLVSRKTWAVVMKYSLSVI